MGKTAFLLAALLAAASCGDSRVNPTTWFGRSSETAGTAARDAASVDPRPLIGRIDSLAVLPSSDGAVIRATGVAPVQGYWNGALVPVETDNPTVLAYTLRAEPPTGPARASTERSREVTVALELTGADLAGIREIRVAGAENAQAVRR